MKSKEGKLRFVSASFKICYFLALRNCFGDVTEEKSILCVCNVKSEKMAQSNDEDTSLHQREKCLLLTVTVISMKDMIITPVSYPDLDLDVHIIKNRFT